MDVREKLIEIVCDAMESDGCIGHCNHSPCFEVERVVNALIANGVTVQEWVSAKEPPKERGEYLCYFKYEPESPDIICQNTYYGSGCWMADPGRVTHWTYLPQPPKGD